MMTAYIATVLAVALIRLAPDLPLSRLLDEWLARRPAAWLARRTRREVLAWTIAAGLLLAGGEYVLVLGGPHAVLAFAAELATYVDALVAVVSLAAVTSGRGLVRRFCVRRTTQPLARRRRRRTGKSASRAPANDDDRPARASWLPDQSEAVVFANDLRGYLRAIAG